MSWTTVTRLFEGYKIPGYSQSFSGVSFSDSLHVYREIADKCKAPLRGGLCRRSVSCSQCSLCAEGKKGLCCHQWTKETDATGARTVAGYLCAAIHHQYRRTSLVVCLCYLAVIDRAPLPPPGSAMSGLDGLIGAEERIINSKPKVSENVVRALLSVCECVRASKPIFLSDLREALLKQNTGHEQLDIIPVTPIWYNCADKLMSTLWFHIALKFSI